ncbi:MAG: pilus assembly protein PilM [Candidatus Uhrbacteria bacterium]|nr:pilus assembly protein PilM [Candidatus Uhrbacteria bacterium]
MSLFGKKEKSTSGLIGVDVGAGGIKAVEFITEGKRLRLSTYGYSSFKDPGKHTEVLLDDPKKAGEVLRRILNESGMKSTRANAALPSHSVFHAIITIPQPRSAKEDLKPLIENQVRKLLPRPLDEMILDSTVIDKEMLPKAHATEKDAKQKEGEKGKEGEKEVDKPAEFAQDRKHMRVLVSGAPKDLVQKYVEMFKAAKLDLASLETEAFALIRSLVGNDKSRIMIVDIGYERTNITIVHEGFPFLHRSIKTGGSSVTSMISKQMGISLEDAEQTKLDLAISPPPGGLPPVLKEAMMPILHEIKYSLELYAQQEFHQNQTVEKIILTGGSAGLPQIDPFITEALNISVYLGDPWARIAAPEGLRSVLNEIGPRFSVAAGLAMKEIK